MVLKAEGPIGAIQANSRYAAPESAGVRFSTAGSSKNSVLAAGGKAVNVVSFSTIQQALNLLSKQDPLPIPQSVAVAIQSLIQDALNGLPKSRQPFL